MHLQADLVGYIMIIQFRNNTLWMYIIAVQNVSANI